MIDALANFVVGLVRAGHRRRAWLSSARVGAHPGGRTAYLFVGALRVHPLASTYRVTVQFPESGGLLPNQDVTLRGVPIGRVQSLDITPDGVNAIVDLGSAVPIPSPAT